MKDNRKLKLYGVTLAILTLSLPMLALTLPKQAQADDAKPLAEILHWWSSEGESKALKVFIDEFEARGGHFYDSSKDNHTASREEAISRMSKGYPATFTQWNMGSDVKDFYNFGLTDAISNPALVNKLKTSLPKPILDLVTYQDKIIAIPLNMHSENWMWFSNTHLGNQSATLSGDWSEFLAKGKLLAEKGIPLIAVGDQQWQVRILFSSVFLGISRDAHKAFFQPGDNPVFPTQEFTTVLTVFNTLAQYSQSFGNGNWDEQVRAVAENQAAANFMGDWAKGEFLVHGKQAGKDYGCTLTPSKDKNLLLTVDALMLGKVTSEREKQGQELMLEVVSDPQHNLEFNLLKGSVSPYSLPAKNQLDVCTQQVYSVLEYPDAVIAPYATYSDGSGFLARVDSALYEFWKQSVAGDVSEESITAMLDTLNGIFAERTAAKKQAELVD